MMTGERFTPPLLTNQSNADRGNMCTVFFAGKGRRDNWRLPRPRVRIYPRFLKKSLEFHDTRKFVWGANADGGTRVELVGPMLNAWPIAR
jgi:hypothetical protein